MTKFFSWRAAITCLGPSWLIVFHLGNTHCKLLRAFADPRREQFGLMMAAGCHTRTLQLASLLNLLALFGTAHAGVTVGFTHSSTTVVRPSGSVLTDNVCTQSSTMTCTAGVATLSMTATVTSDVVTSACEASSGNPVQIVSLLCPFAPDEGVSLENSTGTLGTKDYSTCVRFSESIAFDGSDISGSSFGLATGSTNQAGTALTITSDDADWYGAAVAVYPSGNSAACANQHFSGWSSARVMDYPGAVVISRVAPKDTKAYVYFNTPSLNGALPQDMTYRAYAYAVQASKKANFDLYTTWGSLISAPTDKCVAGTNCATKYDGIETNDAGTLYAQTQVSPFRIGVWTALSSTISASNKNPIYAEPLQVFDRRMIEEYRAAEAVLNGGSGFLLPTASGSNSSSTGTPEFILIEGLTNGLEYTVIVVAESPMGLGPDPEMYSAAVVPGKFVIFAFCYNPHSVHARFQLHFSLILIRSVLGVGRQRWPFAERTRRARCFVAERC